MSCRDVIKGAKPESEGNEAEAGGEGSTSYCFKADGNPATLSVGSAKIPIKDICPKACGVCGAVPTKDTPDKEMGTAPIFSAREGKYVEGGTCATLAESCATRQQVAFMCPETCGPLDACDHHAYVEAQRDCMANAASYGQTIGECEADIPKWTIDANGDCAQGPDNCWAAMTEKECPDPTPLTCEEKGESAHDFEQLMYDVSLGKMSCGDVIKLQVKVEDGKITDAKFKTFGCGSAIASSSLVTEWVKGDRKSVV